MPVLYALAARLIERRGALLASVVLAVSPLHLWYSQEARMYALAVLLVALSYLALVKLFWRPPRWAPLLYGLTVLLALYTDFSTVFAIVPQGFVLLLLVRRDWRLGLRSAAAAALAVLAFVPWILAAFERVGKIANNQAWFLTATPRHVADSLLAVAGLGGQASYYWGNARTPWFVWGSLRPLFFLVLVAGATAGAWALARQSRLAQAVTAAILCGTVATAIAISLYSPSYADRTVLYAVLGWAILLGAVVLRRPTDAWWLGGTSAVVALLLLSSLAIQALYTSSDKQHYRDFAEAIDHAVATTDLPVVVDSSLTGVFLDLYAPSLPKKRLTYLEEERIPERVTAPGSGSNALWLAYADYAWEDRTTVKAQLASLGYRRTEQHYFDHALFVERYERAPAGSTP